MDINLDPRDTPFAVADNSDLTSPVEKILHPFMRMDITGIGSECNA
jgi:hypothetical protein